MRNKIFAKSLLVLATVALGLYGLAPAHAQQASLVLSNCNSALCNTNDTEWSLDKTPQKQDFTGAGSHTIKWLVSATRGQTSENTIQVNGVVTVTNSGSLPAPIGNIVINLQKPRSSNTGACSTIPWVSAAANVANAFAGDAATSVNIVAAASAESADCNALQGAANYTVSGATGVFIETASSGKLEFTDASTNTPWSLNPQQSLAPNESVTLLYVATFNNNVLGLPVDSNVRAEVIVSFGNAGPRGGSGASAANVDINGNSVTDTDETLVRSVACRVSQSVPALIAGNDSVTLRDETADLQVARKNVTLSNFSGFGTSTIDTSTELNVSVDAFCTPAGQARLTNPAYLTGSDVLVTLTGPENEQYEFACVPGVDLLKHAKATVTCDLPVSGL